VSGLAAGVAHGVSAFRARRDPGDAMRVAKDAAAQRESELDEELRSADRDLRTADQAAQDAPPPAA
jgi:Sec-independent protein translocase protein TatA